MTTKLSFAVVHHANQFLITDGYENRSGISKVAGRQGSKMGLLRILEIHRNYHVPLNLHISGTLLESLAWHYPEFFDELESLAKLGLLELIGSSYGQNMMKFFPREHNLRQLNEHLLLYENLLGWKPNRIKVFWVPERLWDTSILAPILGDRELLNGGYRYVILDDRLLYSDIGNPSPRRIYDKNQTWDAKNFLMYEIEQGLGLFVLPIANNLRQNIPPRSPENLTKVKAQLAWLYDLTTTSNETNYIAIYADDMEKAAGVGWDLNGPIQYEHFVDWIRTNKQQLDSVKITDWASQHAAFDNKNIERGTYVELMNEFGAGESFENWYCDPRWTIPYQRYYDWAASRVVEFSKHGADPDLIELAWKVLLATSWQTAWHTPNSGAHGNPNSDGGPSAWVKATTSHARIAAIIAEAAHWMKMKNDVFNTCDVDHRDIDQDGNIELTIKNNFLFCVFSPTNGGRLLYLFSVKGVKGGRLVVGNPADDWNLLEDLHGYMDTPANHPGAFADVGYEHDRFKVVKIEKSSSHPSQEHEPRITLQDAQENSKAFGLKKTISLRKNVIRVDYLVPPKLAELSTEIGLSPDYLRLLRHGRIGVIGCDINPKLRRWSNKNLHVWVKHENHESGSVFWDNPRQSRFGHGFTVRITSHRNQFFSICIGVELGRSC
jgi:hypothetical protein